jgi:hypothetical protein
MSMTRFVRNIIKTVSFLAIVLAVFFSNGYNALFKKTDVKSQEKDGKLLSLFKTNTAFADVPGSDVVSPGDADACDDDAGDGADC